MITALVPVTALYAALNATLNVGLAARVPLLRLRHKISMGDGGNKELLTAMRVHGNNAEYVPLALLMMLICELCSGKSVVLHILGGTLFVSRLVHAFGMARRPPNVFRAGGVTGTWLVIAAASVYAIMLRGSGSALL